MDLLNKNRDYILRHVDPETHFGLLYSQKHDDCVFLNPLATTLWETPIDFVDPSRDSRLFAERTKIPGAAEYMADVVSDMRQRGLLLSPGEDSQIYENAAKRTSTKSYTLGQIYFYATKECNARCYHCYQPTIRVNSELRQRQPDQISSEAFLELVENALPLGVKGVKITGGEPLLRADLGDIIRGVRRLGVHVSIETNGFLIDEMLANMLVEQEVDVSISLDGGSAAVHDTLRGLPGSFERATKALRILSETGYQPKVIMAISRRNLDEVEQVLDVATRNGCFLVKLNPVNTLGLARRFNRSKILLTTGELVALHKKRKEMESKFGVFVYIEGPPSFASVYEIASGHAAVCPFTNILGVLADGSLSFCGVGNSYPELVFGRMEDKEFDIQRLWQDADLLVQVRHILTRNLQGVCGQCVLESWCKGACPALAYGESLSFGTPHPWCQASFEEGLFPSHYLKP